MKRTLVALTLVAASCRTASDPPPVAKPADATVAELQTSMTELLERLDVLNARLERLEQESGERVSGPQSAGVSPNDDSSRAGGSTAAGQRPALQERYRQAIVLYTRARYAEARTAFQQIFDGNPTSDLADNALFWIGETYFTAGDYGNASRYYRRVVDEFGDQNKAPDALFKLAITFERTGDLILARKTLEEVISRYPYSTPARTAKSELNRIKY